MGGARRPARRREVCGRARFIGALRSGGSGDGGRDRQRDRDRRAAVARSRRRRSRRSIASTPGARRRCTTPRSRALDAIQTAQGTPRAGAAVRRHRSLQRHHARRIWSIRRGAATCWSIRSRSARARRRCSRSSRRPPAAARSIARDPRELVDDVAARSRASCGLSICSATRRRGRSRGRAGVARDRGQRDSPDVVARQTATSATAISLVSERSASARPDARSQSMVPAAAISAIA